MASAVAVSCGGGRSYPGTYTAIVLIHFHLLVLFRSKHKVITSQLNMSPIKMKSHIFQQNSLTAHMGCYDQMYRFYQLRLWELYPFNEVNIPYHNSCTLGRIFCHCQN